MKERRLRGRKLLLVTGSAMALTYGACEAKKTGNDFDPPDVVEDTTTTDGGDIPVSGNLLPPPDVEEADVEEEPDIPTSGNLLPPPEDIEEEPDIPTSGNLLPPPDVNEPDVIEPEDAGEAPDVDKAEDLPVSGNLMPPPEDVWERK